MNSVITLILTLLLSNFSLAKPLEKVILNPYNVVMINSSINLAMIRTLVIEATYVRGTLPANQTMYIILYSNGGDTEIGYEMASAISTLPNTKIICAWCASAAGMIFINSGIPALASSGSQMMMHEMKWVVTLPQLITILSKDIKIQNDFEEKFNSIHYKRMKISKDAYLKKIRNNQFYVQGDDLVKLHLADQMVIIECTKEMRLFFPENCQKLEDK